GAYLNGERLLVDPVKHMKEAMVLFELGYERSEAGVDCILGGLKSLLLGGCRATRHLGSCVLSLCWVACGRGTAYYTGLSSEGGKPWDYAAGCIIAREAGAYLSSLQGTAFQIQGSSCLCAATPELAREMMAALGTSK
ncbi:unnamed protein product, partial [Effrenium voratum]